MIPLSESPKYQFNLVTSIIKLGHKKTETIIKGLPYPNPNQIEINKIDGKEFISSQMYLYI